MSQIDLSIIIPAYQEAAVIESSLAQLSSWLRSHDYGRVEVLVVVADSPDGTATLAASRSQDFESLRVVPAGERVGKGRDVRLGMLEATGRYRLFMDADLATPLQHLDDVYWHMQRGTKAGIGVRNLWGIHNGLERKLITKGGNWLAQIILLPGIKDTQCGFKFFEAQAAEKVFNSITILGWGFDMEALALARKYHYKIAQIQVPDWRDPKAADEGLAGDSATGAAFQVLRDLLRIRWNLITRRYS